MFDSPTQPHEGVSEVLAEHAVQEEVQREVEIVQKLKNALPEDQVIGRLVVTLGLSHLVDEGVYPEGVSGEVEYQKDGGHCQ